jgi:hypothetical protein
LTEAIDEIPAGRRTTGRLRRAMGAAVGVSVGGQVPLAVPARLEAAHALERAVHDLVEDYIRQARQAGRTWYEIGQALDLHWRERLRRQQRSRTLTSMTCRSARRHLQQRTKVN